LHLLLNKKMVNSYFGIKIIKHLVNNKNGLITIIG